MHAYVVFDWETRAAANLKTLGVEKYCECPHFDALCAGYEWPDGSRGLWMRGQPPPADLCEHVAAGLILVAHNAGFELTVWREMRRRDPRWPELRPEQVHDTMAMARAMGFPGALEQVAEAMRLNVRKDMEGAAIMKQLCVPLRAKKGDTTIRFDEDPVKHRRNAEYCMVDVEVQHELYRRLLKLIPIEQQIFAIHERINARGVMVDVIAARNASEIVDAEKKRLSAVMAEASRDKIKNAQSRKEILEWLDTEGVVIGNLKKTTIQAMLDDERALHNQPVAKQVLQLRLEASKASTSKLAAMMRNACSDGRVRGLYSFYGANTGRSSGRRVQTQNLLRPPKGFKAVDAKQVISGLKKDGVHTPALLRLRYGSVMGAISAALRSFIMAEPGRRFICCDFSNIEGRVLAWLAGEVWKLQAFRAYDTFVLDDRGQKIPDPKKPGEFLRMGPDLYHVTASGIIGKPVDQIDDDERQVMGKVPELALGFQGGLGAFTSMGANYGVAVVAKREDAPKNAKYVVTEAQAEDIKVKWREKNPNICKLWHGLNDAAKEAVRHPGKVTGAGLIEFCKDGDFLLMRLPSGRCLSYAYPSVEIMTTTFYEREVFKWTKEVEEAAEECNTVEGAKRYGIARDILDELLNNPDRREQLCFWGINSKSKSKRFGKTRAYGGLLAENATQATAREFQFWAALRVEAAGYPIVMHTHDELVTEVPNNFGSVDELSQIMCDNPAWAQGIPVSAAGWVGERYWK